MPLTAQIVLFDGFDPLDVIAPFEVLVAGSDVLSGELAVELVSADGPRTVVSGNRGLTLTATSTLDPDLPGFVVVPGAAGPTEGDPDEIDTIPVLLARFAASSAMPLMQRALDNAEVTVVAVCGGSLALAMAGLLEGRHAATHHLGMDVLDATGAIATHARVVDDGDLVSGGGVTSGLDVALHLLDREFGPEIARAVEDLFEVERRGIVWRAGGRSPVAY
jgi:transcriptional regulator GlxA family with amidase domain